MSASGRRAALPPAGFRPQQRLRIDQETLVVRFVPEDGTGRAKDYDFTVLPVARALQEAFAHAFTARTRPSAGTRAPKSAKYAWSYLSSFARYLADLTCPPCHAGELTEAQVQGWALQRRDHVGLYSELADLKRSLRRVPGISVGFAAALTQPHRQPKTAPAASIYSRDEFRRILAAARFDVRRAAARIREARDLLARWRANAIDLVHDQEQWRRGSLLDHVDRHCDVPRYTVGAREPREWVARLGNVSDHITSLHLGLYDVAAFAVLLVGLTGENPGTIANAPAAHHRPDGYAGTTASAIVELDKPRRGSRRHMDVVWADLPDWIATPEDDQGLTPEDAGDDLRSAFGVYQLLHDLAGPARRLAESDRLFVWWTRGSRGTGTGFRTTLRTDRIVEWAQRRDLPADHSTAPSPNGRSGKQNEQDQPPQIRVTLDRVRRTFLELHQKPVAHTTRTLANNYLLRQRGNITEYQQVVADTLEQEARKARTRSALRVLSPAEVERARTDPTAVAGRYDLDPATLRRMLAGELDTVMAACSDNTNTPYSPPGTPCRASFMLCLSCPCARALPHHLPVQAAVYDLLDAAQDAMTPLRWAERFALPHAQLADLLDRAGPAAVTDARRSLTANQRELVERFLNRELDHS